MFGALGNTWGYNFYAFELEIWPPKVFPLVSSPDPAPKREKGLVYIERFLGLVSEF